MAEQHELKSWPEYFEPVLAYKKDFDLRRDDREPRFEVLDVVVLKEYDPKARVYTGRECFRQIRYILRDAEQVGLPEGFCILGF